MPLPQKNHVDLPHEFVAQPDVKFFGREFAPRSEVDAAGGAHNGINGSDFFEARLQALEVAQVGVKITAFSADVDDLMSSREFVGDCFAERSAGSNQNNF